MLQAEALSAFRPLAGYRSYPVRHVGHSDGLAFGTKPGGENPKIHWFGFEFVFQRTMFLFASVLLPAFRGTLAQAYSLAYFRAFAGCN